MKNATLWKPSKFEWHRNRLRASRDASEVGVGSRLMTDLVAAQYQMHLGHHATGRLLDLGCGKAPLYMAYAPCVSEITCVDWIEGDYVDVPCDLSKPLPFDNARFDTIILSDVLEHLPDPHLVWAEMARVLAPGGKVIMNVPFYYSIHAHPYDYYRYTNFALERFVKENAFQLVHLHAFGGIVEILCDLLAKALSKLRVVGPSVAKLLQWSCGRFGRTRIGARVAQVSSRHFPLGYFMIAQREQSGQPSRAGFNNK